MNSLRARLLWAVGLSTLVLWCMAASISYTRARHEAMELLDGQLAQSARLLMAQVMHEDRDLDESHLAREGHHNEATEVIIEWLDDAVVHTGEAPLEFQLWALPTTAVPAGELLLHSRQSPTLHLQTRVGFADVEYARQTWRVFSARDPDGRYQLQVTQPTQLRDQAAITAALNTLIPLVVLLPILLGLIHFAVGRAIKPLNALADAVAERAPDALTPLPVLPLPEETQPLVQALNALLARLQRALDNERRFTADASHELRTPLAAIKVQAQVAQAAYTAHDAAAHQHALAQMHAGIQRASHLVEQLLRLARLDPLSAPATSTRFDPVRALDETARALETLASERGVEVNFPPPTVTPAVMGDAGMVGIALKNLLENALHHAPPGGCVTLGTQPGSTPGTVEIWVRDTGPGVAADQLQRLTERFFRGQDTPAEGSGLGLAIVQRIAEIHGARLHLQNCPEGGFQATLIFIST